MARKRSKGSGGTPWWRQPAVVVPAAINLLAVVPAYLVLWMQAGQLGLQADQLKVQQAEQARVGEQMRAEQQRWAKEFEHAMADSSRARFHAVLTDLSSSQPERRLAGLRAAAPLIRDDEYSDATRIAVIESFATQLNRFVRDKELPLSSIEPFVRAAASSLKARTTCTHLKAVINELYAKMEAAKALPSRTALGADPRLAQLLGQMRQEIGASLFCGYLADCANKVDVTNSVEGRQLEWDSDMRTTTRREIPAGALMELSGYVHAPPSAPPESPLVDLVGMCSPAQREKIKGFICAMAVFSDSGENLGPTPACKVLSQVNYLPGGWTAFGATVE